MTESFDRIQWIFNTYLSVTTNLKEQWQGKVGLFVLLDLLWRNEMMFNLFPSHSVLTTYRSWISFLGPELFQQKSSPCSRPPWTDFAGLRVQFDREFFHWVPTIILLLRHWWNIEHNIYALSVSHKTYQTFQSLMNTPFTYQKARSGWLMVGWMVLWLHLF